MSASVAADRLGKRCTATWALQSCTLTIPAGTVTALIGPNGAGKSTFLSLVVGLTQPTTGSIAVLGRDPRHDAAVLPRIGFVGQDRPLDPGFTVAEMLRPRFQEPREAVGEAFVGLESRSSRTRARATGWSTVVSSTRLATSWRDSG